MTAHMVLNANLHTEAMNSDADRDSITNVVVVIIDSIKKVNGSRYARSSCHIATEREHQARDVKSQERYHRAVAVADGGVKGRGSMHAKAVYGIVTGPA